jgi:hypothetical protein
VGVATYALKTCKKDRSFEGWQLRIRFGNPAGLFAGSFGCLLDPRNGALAAVLGIGLYTVLVGANLNPRLVLLSVSARDGDGRPAPEMLENIQGYTLLRTDRNGWIELTTDGEQLWVEVQRR